MADVSSQERAPKKSKKKNKKLSETPEVPHKIELAIRSKGEKRKMESGVNGGEEVVVKKPKNKSLNKDTEDDEAEDSNCIVMDDMTVEFEKHDLVVLLDRISDLLPDNDVMSFKKRIGKIDWDQVAFKDYSPKVCQKLWLMIQRKLRQNRILKELISDARGWTSTEWKQNLIAVIHPDFPHRPLTSGYQLFYQIAKKYILEKKPDATEAEIGKIAITVYTSLEPETLGGFERAAASNKKCYERAVEEFYNNHPDLQTIHQTEKEKPQPKGPQKPSTPFALYVKDQMAKHTEIIDKFLLREACKENWKSMDDKAKLYWIDLALESEKVYFEEVHKNPSLGKSILSKKEWRIKEVMSGKPQKPPSTAYGLFIQVVNKSNILRDILPQEKMRKISVMWRVLPEDEKNNYKKDVIDLKQNYKHQLEEYNKKLEQHKSASDSDKIPVEQTVNAVTIKEEPEDPVSDAWQNEPMELLGVVVPKSWPEMGEYEKSMYFKYIEKIRNYFDEKHSNLSTSQENGEEKSEEEEEKPFENEEAKSLDDEEDED